MVEILHFADYYNGKLVSDFPYFVVKRGKVFLSKLNTQHICQKEEINVVNL